MEAPAFDMFDITQIYSSLAWAIGPTIVAAAILLWLRLRRRLSGHKAYPSEGVRKTPLASLDGDLPPDLNLIAGIGRGAAAPQTFNDKYLRPTVGLRLIMFGFPVLLYFIMQSLQTVQGANHPDERINFIFAGFLLVLMVHNIIYFNIYELRYDDTRIVHRTWFYRQLELPMSRLLSIRDDGMYFYVLHSDNGKKAYVPKHLIGVEDFLRSVRAAISKNDEL